MNPITGNKILIQPVGLRTPTILPVLGQVRNSLDKMAFMKAPSKVYPPVHHRLKDKRVERLAGHQVVAERRSIFIDCLQRLAAQLGLASSLCVATRNCDTGHEA
jgi:hypothetical protein